MVRCALPCLALAVTLTACGGKAKPPKIPHASIPGPTAWDGKAAGDDTVLFVSTLPGDASKFVAYEVNTRSCSIDRTIVDEIDKLGTIAVTTITDPRQGAGTILIVRNPPPPPPEGGDRLLMDALQLTQPGNPSPACGPRPPAVLGPTHK